MQIARTQTISGFSWTINVYTEDCKDTNIVRLKRVDALMGKDWLAKRHYNTHMGSEVEYLTNISFHKQVHIKSSGGQDHTLLAIKGHKVCGSLLTESSLCAILVKTVCTEAPSSRHGQKASPHKHSTACRGTLVRSSTTVFRPSYYI